MFMLMRVCKLLTTAINRSFPSRLQNWCRLLASSFLRAQLGMNVQQKMVHSPFTFPFIILFHIIFPYLLHLYLHSYGLFFFLMSSFLTISFTLFLTPSPCFLLWLSLCHQQFFFLPQSCSGGRLAAIQDGDALAVCGKSGVRGLRGHKTKQWMQSGSFHPELSLACSNPSLSFRQQVHWGAIADCSW